MTICASENEKVFNNVFHTDMTNSMVKDASAIQQSCILPLKEVKTEAVVLLVFYKTRKIPNSLILHNVIKTRI